MREKEDLKYLVGLFIAKLYSSSDFIKELIVAYSGGTLCSRKETNKKPYSKPTQVDWYILLRRLREFILRNSAK